MLTAAEKQATESLTDPALDTLQSIASLHARNERSVSRPQRFVESTITAVGRPRFLAVTLIFVAAWIAIDLVERAAHFAFRDDLPFDMLNGILTLAALLLTIMILIAQNRQALIAERRAQLDLQISLLTDQKIAKIIALIEELRRDSPQVRDRTDLQAEAMQSAADPEAMLVALDYILTEGATAEEAHASRDNEESLREEVAEIDEAMAELKAVRRGSS